MLQSLSPGHATLGRLWRAAFLMDTSLLNCRRMTTGLLFPARQFQPGQLNRLYASVTDRYPYQTLQHLPDGVRMANPEDDCILQGGQPPNPGRLQVNENNIFHYEAAKEKALGVFQAVCTEMDIQQFLTFGVKLTAFLPVEGANAAQMLENSALAGLKPYLDRLGQGRQGTGLRVVIHNQGAFDLKIEPFFNDISQLYIEEDAQFPEPMAGLQAVEQKMDRAYRFLNEDVREFLAELAPHD